MKQKGQKGASKPKKTRQGMSNNTKLSKSPKNNRRKRYRGQGK